MKNKYPSSQEHASNLVKLTAFKLTSYKKGHKHFKKGGNLTPFGKVTFFLKPPKKYIHKKTNTPPKLPHTMQTP